MKLLGARVTIRLMQRSDVEAMLEWRPFADPLYQPFDFPRDNPADQLQWFDWRSQDPSRQLYAIENEVHQVIGSLTLREIDGRHSARLGITVGADFVSQGYGTEALHLFLGYFFGEQGFAQMILDVSATNLRAIRCYQALGFRSVGRHYRLASHPSYRIIRCEPRYRHLRRYFQLQGLVYYVVFHDMVLTRKEWQDAVSNRDSL